jgi:type VI secretion system protein ImpE
MNAEGLLREGKLDEAVQALSEHLRDHPEDSRSRTFLFELLCFRGEFDRASRQLQLLGGEGKEAGLGALLYEAALHAERLRADVFRGDHVADPPAPSDLRGTLNGTPFTSLSDSDPRIGAQLELFAAGDYLRIPFDQLTSVEIRPPVRLRDLLWATAVIAVSPSYPRRDLREVLVPVLCPTTFQHPDGPVRLGRITEWCRDEHGREHPYGQKMLLVDGEEFPFLEIRTLQIARTEAAAP